ncbi:leucine-rich repeat protein 1-like [Capsicum annuum]
MGLPLKSSELRDLGNTNISGSLRPALVELYSNNIEGKIPKELGNVENLVSMDLYGNKFEGNIPKSFAKLKSLRFLRLNDNKLIGSIPRELTTLPNLKVLDVSHNDLCGTIPVDGPFESFPMEGGSAAGFKLDNLFKLNGTRSWSNKMTLMHYLCKYTC